MKKLEWLYSSKKDLAEFPEDVIHEIGYALHCAQMGRHYKKSKPFKGYGSGVFEIVIEYDTNAYRSVYTVEMDDVIYVVHCFQKKSKHGMQTPKEEMAIIKQRITRLRASEE